MSNIRNKPNHITPQLTLMWDKSDEPWGARDRESRFIYANPAFYQRLNLPEDFNIIGLSMGELPSSIAEYAEEFHRQDQKAIQTMQRVTSLETHQLGGGITLNKLIFMINFHFVMRIMIALGSSFICINPMDFKMHRDGKGVNPREHR
nr:PAS domain-containing protein [Photorhabdus kleinii]